jgi:phage host-nuclease inhibitor protein Gam
MAKRKTENSELQSVAECTRAMGELLTATTQLETLIADRDAAIAKVQAVYEKPVGVARQWTASLAAKLETYYYTHLAEMEEGGRKHFKLENGVMGRRFGPGKLAPLNRAWTWHSITAKVRELFGPSKYFRFSEPELDKIALKDNLDAEKLAAVGLKVKNDETFYAEPDRPETPDAPSRSSDKSRLANASEVKG